MSEKRASAQRSPPIFLAGLACALMAAGSGTAQAGGFAIREQSASSIGDAFAGVAAGTASLSSMFWNPATLTDMPGLQSSANANGIFPYANLTPREGTSPVLLPLGPSGNIAPPGVLPSLYNSDQINNRLWLGLALNAPFGLSSQPNIPSASEIYGMKSAILSVEISPSMAYKINDFVSVAAGVRFLYLDVSELTAMAPLPTPPVATLKGNAWGVTFSLGTTLRPFAGAEIGIGYRGRVKENIGGNLTLGAPIGAIPAGTYSAKAGLPIPDSVSVGAKQRITDRLMLAGTVEWTDWSLLKSVAVVGSPIPGLAIPLFYRDGWMFSLGGEYKWNASLTLRAGVGYEQSPVTTAIREVRNPDTNRKWASVGLTHTFNDKLSLDLAYAHYPSGNTPVAIVPGNPNFALVGLPFVGNVSGRLDIVAIGLNYRWD